MAYDFEARHSLLASKMRDRNYRNINIVRDGTTLFTAIPATVYEIPNEELINGGISLNFRRQDYFISASDASGYTPANGDLIVANDTRYPTDTLQAEVSKLGDRPQWEWTSHNRVTMRIRAKVIVD